MIVLVKKSSSSDLLEIEIFSFLGKKLRKLPLFFVVFKVESSQSTHLSWEERGEDLVAKYIAERDSEEAEEAASEMREESVVEKKVTPRELELDEWASSSSEEEDEEPQKEVKKQMPPKLRRQTVPM